MSIETVIGGAERVLYEQTVRFIERDYTVHVITRLPPENHDDKHMIGKATEWRYRINKRNAAAYFITTWRNSFKLFRRLYYQFRYDALIIHQPFSALGIIHSKFGRKLKKYYVCHSLSFEEYMTRNKRSEKPLGMLSYIANTQFRKFIERRILRSCDGVAVLSDFTKEKLIDVYRIPSAKITLNPGGVDLERFKPAVDKKAVRRKLGMPHDRFILLSIRNLVQRMGIGSLLEAIAQVTREATDILLIIGGSGPLKDSLSEKAAKLGIQDHVQFKGFIPEAEIAEYYKMADLFVLPTKELEGFGLVTLEAMASGVPVLGTPVGGTKEILGRFDKSFLFNDTSPDAMADLIIEKLSITRKNPKQWQEACKKCRRYVEENYSWEKHIDTLENTIAA